MSFTRSLLIFLGALIFSALLWSYVRLSAAYETDVDLPIKLTAPKGYALAAGLPERLHARVRGAGWQILLMNAAKNGNFQFDLADRAVPIDGPFVLRTDEITNSAVMPSELRVLKVEPDSLKLFFSNALEKRVPVASQVTVTPSPGYVLVGEPRVTPAFVTVVGARNILDTLRSIPTNEIDVRGATEDVDQTIALTSRLDNSLSIPNAPKIAVHIDVQAVGEQTIVSVPVTIDALPPQFEVILIPGAVNVTIRGGVDELAKLPRASIRAHVTYDPMVFDTAHTIVPQVVVPAGFAYLGEDPPRVKFIIRRKAVPGNATP